MQFAWAKYSLNFKFEARTSRETMRTKQTYLLRATADDGRTAYGECALFRGLSADDVPDYEERLAYYCTNPHEVSKCTMSSVRFGFETAMAGLAERDPFALWHSGNVHIPINGLIWMGDKHTMQQRIDAKLDEGFRVLKLKIGGINFADELDLLRMIRSRYSAHSLELRLDANGSFSPEQATECLAMLSKFAIHSIEQPLKAGQQEVMARLCADSPIPIALDEEIIGCTGNAQKHDLLDAIRPAYIILKPALCGGLSGATEWAHAAEDAGLGYWFTSALESNFGLDPIAGLAASLGVSMPQGLGTGELYYNNVMSPIARQGSALTYNPKKSWEIPTLDWHTANS